MYNDPYYPSLSEDPYLCPSAYSETEPEAEASAEWVYSQELDPIIPYPEGGAELSEENQTVSMAERSNRPMPDRPVPPIYPPQPPRPQPPRPQPPRPQPPRPQPPRPQPPRPQPPRPQPPRPQPPRPQPPRPQPPRPQPPRPQPPRPQPPRPQPPRPNWSWNWGIVLPGVTFPISIARVRFYNAAVREPIQIYVNNRPVVSNLNFLNFTQFYNVAPGRYRITVYRGSNLSNPIVDTWMSFLPNTSYTVTVAGSGFNFWLETMTF